MSKIGYLLMDGMNICHAANSGPILKSGEQETQAIYYSLRTIRKAISTFPMLKPVVLWDGPINWRKKAFPDYKANRDKAPETKHEIESQRRRASLKVQLPMLKRGLRAAGVTQMVATNLEADDLAGILTRRYAAQGLKVMLQSGDKDWLQLLQPGVGWFDTINELRITQATFTSKIGYERKTKNKATGEEIVEWRGVPNPQAFLEVKALMGDPSDNIPGVGGIGEKGAVELVIRFGSVQHFFEQVEIEKIDVPKKLADFCASPDKKDIFYRNMRLMNLAHGDIPAPQGIILNKDPTDVDAFTAFCGEFAFGSILADVPGWLATINNQH